MTQSPDTQTPELVPGDKYTEITKSDAPFPDVEAILDHPPGTTMDILVYLYVLGTRVRKSQIVSIRSGEEVEVYDFFDNGEWKPFHRWSSDRWAAYRLLEQCAKIHDTAIVEIHTGGSLYIAEIGYTRCSGLTVGAAVCRAALLKQFTLGL